MGNTAQKRALRNYRTRLAKRGKARFEVLGLDVDRDLIRSLAKRLAEDDLDAVRIRAVVSQIIAGEPTKKGRILERDEFRLRRILHFRSNWRIPLR